MVDVVGPFGRHDEVGFQFRLGGLAGFPGTSIVAHTTGCGRSEMQPSPCQNLCDLDSAAMEKDTFYGRIKIIMFSWRVLALLAFIFGCGFASP
jgi:hypothetical protein